MKTLLLTNLVYMSDASGPLYPDLWLTNGLKSILDDSNLPELKRNGWKLEFALFSDDQTMMHISRHPNFMQLSALCEIHLIKMEWPPDADKFASRYGLLTQMVNTVIPIALEKDAVVGAWVADLVFAKGSLPKMLGKMGEGHDAIFMMPMRGAADCIQPALQALPGAPTDLELFELCYKGMHHLWTHSMWDSPLFSKFPYSMLWNSGTGLVAHNFGITPIVWRPSKDFGELKGGIDSDLPAWFKKPFWATDWTDAPVACVEPLSNGHYPPFLNHRASEEFVVDWAKRSCMPNQFAYLQQAFYYPTKEAFAHAEVDRLAQHTVDSIASKLHE